MLIRLLLLFTLVPLVELALLLRVGGLIGLGPTILLVVGTGLAGAWMARREGLRSWTAVQEELAAGRFPAGELLHSLLILVAGAVLLTPGVLTDVAGLLLLVRPVRAAAIRGLRGRFEARLEGARGAGSGDFGGDGFSFTWWSVGSGIADGVASRPGGEEPGSDGADGRVDGWERRGGSKPPAEGDEEEETSRRAPRIIEM